MSRRRNNTSNLIAAVVGCVAVLLYAFSAIGSHGPGRHASTTILASDSHLHEDGGHSHDEFDIADEDPDVSDHHHADHTHEKAGLVGANGSGIRLAVNISYPTRSPPLVTGPSYGIDRPPRL